MKEVGGRGVRVEIGKLGLDMGNLEGGSVNRIRV